MNIIVPMAGAGKRMRPHTLTTPKPLIPVAGKPIVQRLVEDLAAMCHEPINEIAFIVGQFGTDTEKSLIKIAESLGAKGSIHYQNEPLGTAHAIMCAKQLLQGNVIVAFADTLFTADFKINTNDEAVIYVHEVENPSAFGVVKTNDAGIITDFIEKPQTPVSNKAIIGIYYFKDGDNLKSNLQYLLDNKIMVKGEYQLTDALENMKNKGLQFTCGKVTEWLDCGNKDATVFTNQRVLANNKSKMSIPENTKIVNSTIIEPCYIGECCTIENSVIGPYVSIGNHVKIKKTVIENSIIQHHAEINNANVQNSMIGGFASYCGAVKEFSISDFSTII